MTHNEATHKEAVRVIKSGRACIVDALGRVYNPSRINLAEIVSAIDALEESPTVTVTEGQLEDWLSADAIRLRMGELSDLDVTMVRRASRWIIQAMGIQVTEGE